MRSWQPALPPTFEAATLLFHSKNFQPMAASLTYAFNRDRLLALISRPRCETVVFSLVNLIKKSHDEKEPHNEAYMYIYAQAHDANDEAIIAQDIAGSGGEEGCPVPPGWQCNLEPPTIKQEQLDLAARFSIEQSKLLPLVEQNKFEMIGKDEKAQEVMMNQLLISLEGELTGEGLEPCLVFTCLSKGRLAVGEAVKAFSYTPQKAKNPAPVQPTQP